ncbi:hypothetical protein V5P93_006703 [Actinokineospora auranticolor]|uniref:Uncharacterized protein n=1 Tax=Actinokineospora auranticolor TaxID=155976 RepID=A0A2S6GWQ7_9PSEU|nr:hypothetical protein [Actinokineospora auranticolor]PPK69654.1 hypothetical protein CLV40_103264 [Actinokineospora auranticolor]
MLPHEDRHVPVDLPDLIDLAALIPEPRRSPENHHPRTPDPNP